MTRILHISTRLILGGSQENTILSCEGQAGLGHEVHLAYGPIYGPEGSMLDRVRALGGIETHEVPHMIRPVRPVADVRAYRELKGLIDSIKPDVVHTHSSKAGILGRLAAWKAKCKPAVVHTIHGPPFLPGKAVSNAIYTVAERIAARRCDAIVSVADSMTRQFLERGIGRPALYTTVRSGVDIEPYLASHPTRDEVRERLGIEPHELVVGTVARLAEDKGHDDLLDALGEDLKTNNHWRLLWVGDGYLRQRLEQRIESMGLAGRVVFSGLVPPADVPAMLRAMDVLAHPSYREGLPRTVTQALLAGVCPVAYDCDGTPEICRHKRTGWLIPTGDRVALGEAVRHLAAKPDERMALAAAGREVAGREFSAAAMVAGLEHVYRQALSARDLREPDRTANDR
ncbi:MAG: glycosyltransferase family 4 protein [Phycisphaera sp.]|nr:MAG: glycosyltransferase family 4 protein [Phycisphaera sp.]